MDNKIKKIILSKTLKKYNKLSKILKYIFVNICKIDQKKYYILGSFAIREHRKINDLDINLDKDEFMKLQNATTMGFGKIEFYNNQIRWFFDLTKEYNKLTSSKEKDFSIEAFMKDPKIGFPNNKFSLSSLTKNKGLSIDKNNHQFLNLEYLLKWKKCMNREKDKADIELIKKILKK
tara:strand:+ start:344 stop:874 length:531 start_codon:yes stop_codon:yes gene_type:complete